MHQCCSAPIGWAVACREFAQPPVVEIIHGVTVRATSPHAVPRRSFFAEIPSRLKPYYHYFNTYADARLEYGDSPLRHIREVTKPEDYVLLKLDVDNTDVEEAIVQSLLANPDIIALIDEFFWEHHVNFKPMFPGWGGRGDRWDDRRRLLQWVFTGSLAVPLATLQGR